MNSAVLDLIQLICSQDPPSGSGNSIVINEKEWLPVVDAFRAFAACQLLAIRVVFQHIQALPCDTVGMYSSPKSACMAEPGYAGIIASASRKTESGGNSPKILRSNVASRP